MKTRSQRTGLKNVTNIKGNARISKAQKVNTSRNARVAQVTTAMTEEEKASPTKPLDAHATPKKVKHSNEVLSVMNTPRTPSSVFQAAKSAFRRCSTPAKLIGRDEERKAIQAFIEHHVCDTKPGALYISGCPGTGKTALLTEVCKNLEPQFKNSSHKIIKIFINCMNVLASNGIFSAIASEIDKDIKVSKNHHDDLECILVPPKKSNKLYFVILDEIDQLITSDNQVLYKLFEWASKKQSRLVLIGIANALNLMDRFLPRLKGAPVLLNFNPYKVNEISAIIQNRLMSVADPDVENELNGVPLMQKAAIEIAARKIASGGDLRKALDICRRAIELVETEAQVNQETASQSNFNSPIQSIDEVPKVNIRHIMTASSSLNDSQSMNRLNGLHANQKMVLITMVIIKDLLGSQQKMDSVFEHYTRICRSNGMDPASKTVFTELITVLENAGLISVKNTKKSKESMKSATLSLNVRSEDIIKSCEGSHMLEKVLPSVKK